MDREGARPLHGEEIRSYLHEVAEELPDGTQHVLVLVGGALLAWANLRSTTADVDTIRRLDAELRRAVQTVASRHDLATTWVNDSAAGYIPQTLRDEDFQVLLEHERLIVYGAGWRDVFLMKMAAARDRDWDDLVALWQRAGFSSDREAVDAFYEAYPHEPSDPHLDRWVATIRREAVSHPSSDQVDGRDG